MTQFTSDKWFTFAAYPGPKKFIWQATSNMSGFWKDSQFLWIWGWINKISLGELHLLWEGGIFKRFSISSMILPKTFLPFSKMLQQTIVFSFSVRCPESYLENMQIADVNFNRENWIDRASTSINLFNKMILPIFLGNESKFVDR